METMDRDIRRSGESPRFVCGYRKSPTLAVFLSLMPGLGQVYAGFYRRGFTFMLVAAITVSALSLDLGPLDTLLSFFLSFFWLFNMVDAAAVTKCWNRAVELGERVEASGLGADMSVPLPRSPLWLGFALSVLGVFLLAVTKFDYSLGWIREWWPVALISLGSYLTYKGVQERRKQGAGV